MLISERQQHGISVATRDQRCAAVYNRKSLCVYGPVLKPFITDFVRYGAALEP